MPSFYLLEFFSQLIILSHLTEGFETVRKAVPVSSLFLSYMEPLCHVLRAKLERMIPGRRIIGTTEGCCVDKRLSTGGGNEMPL
jgi:hypothetical protein